VEKRVSEIKERLHAGVSEDLTTPNKKPKDKGHTDSLRTLLPDVVRQI